jgi:hypothetical protein
MRPARVCGRALGASVIGVGLSLLLATSAAADPTDAPADPSAPVSAPLADPLAAAMPPDQGAGVVAACNQFGAAINYAATNYEDFAYNSAGGGNLVNYQDPTVANSNVLGRTALREAAAAAMSASNFPGVPPEVSAPMRSWSLHATKLVLIMGLRGGGDSLNNSANDMNTNAHDAQLACAANGARA